MLFITIGKFSDNWFLFQVSAAAREIKLKNIQFKRIKEN